MEDAYDWPWLETTQTGAAPLTMTDLKSILYVIDTTNDRTLTEADIRDFANDADTVGDPYFWHLDGVSTLRVYPLKVVNLSVRYIKFSPELTGTDTPVIPVRYHPIWVDLAAVEAYKDADDYTAVNSLLPDIDRRIEQMIQVYAWRNHQGPGMQALTYSAEDW